MSQAPLVCILHQDHACLGALSIIVIVPTVKFSHGQISQWVFSESKKLMGVKQSSARIFRGFACAVWNQLFSSTGPMGLSQSLTNVKQIRRYFHMCSMVSTKLHESKHRSFSDIETYPPWQRFYIRCDVDSVLPWCLLIQICTHWKQQESFGFVQAKTWAKIWFPIVFPWTKPLKDCWFFCHDHDWDLHSRKEFVVQKPWEMWHGPPASNSALSRSDAGLVLLGG